MTTDIDNNERNQLSKHGSQTKLENTFEARLTIGTNNSAGATNHRVSIGPKSKSTNNYMKGTKASTLKATMVNGCK